MLAIAPGADAAAAAAAAGRAVARAGAAGHPRSCSASLRAIATEQRTHRARRRAERADLALDIADHAHVLETGRIALTGTGRRDRGDDGSRRSYLGPCLDARFLQQIVDGIAAGSIYAAWRWPWC